MYLIVSEYDFTRAFRVWHGGVYKDNFSYHGLQALYEWLEGCYCKDYGMKLDVVWLCDDFAQYKSIAEYNEYYESDYKTIEELEEAGMCSVIRVEGEEFIVDIH